jgi:nucleotide-binding universal stress UspA family protein
MRVLIALDDSSVSRAALYSVRDRLWPDGTSFNLCTVVPALCDRPYAAYRNAATLAKLRKEMSQQAGVFLQACFAGFKAALPQSNVSAEIEYGDVAEKIVSRASMWGADLIVMGSNIRSPIQKHALGSVAEAVVERATCDVDVIKLQPIIGNLKIAEQTKVLVCYDGSPHAKAAVNWITAGAWTPDQAFIVLTVVGPRGHQDLLQSIYHHADSAHLNPVGQVQYHLDQLVRDLQRNLPSNPIQPMVVEGFAAESILQVADGLNCGLVILGAHNDDPAVSPNKLSSLARAVAGQAKCCVKIVRQRSHIETDTLLNELKLMSVC